MNRITFLVISIILTGCVVSEKSKEVINSEAAPAAIGPYSQAISFEDHLYVSGQLGIIPATGKLAEGFEAQVRQSLDNANAILKEAGFTLKDVVRCQVFLVDMENYKSFNEIYKEYFPGDYPARAVVEVSQLPAGGLVEVMMEARK